VGITAGSSPLSIEQISCTAMRRRFHLRKMGLCVAFAVPPYSHSPSMRRRSTGSPRGTDGAKCLEDSSTRSGLVEVWMTLIETNQSILQVMKQHVQRSLLLCHFFTRASKLNERACRQAAVFASVS